MGKWSGSYPSAVEPRLSGMTTGLGYALLQPAVDAPSTSTELWRNTESFFPCRRRAYKGGRSWQWNNHRAYIPLMGGICW
jgi:hypothetical protein